MAAVDLCHDYIIWPTGEYHKSLSKRLPTVFNRLCFVRGIQDHLTRFMGQTSCILLGLECHVWHMRNEINVMEYF